MRFRHILALVALFFASPSLAATLILHPEGVEKRAGLQLDRFLSEGVYLAQFKFDKAAEPGSLLTFIHDMSYDFFGLDDGIHYGGNDVPTFRDHYFAGSTLSTLLRVERPYRLIEYWGGDVGYIEELGYYHIDAVLGEFTFPSTDPVRLDYNIERISAVPEPASWAVMIVGLGVAGWMKRRRSHKCRAKFATAPPREYGTTKRLETPAFAGVTRLMQRSRSQGQVSIRTLPGIEKFAKLLSAKRSGSGQAKTLCRRAASGAAIAAGAVAIRHGGADRDIEQLSKPAGA